MRYVTASFILIAIVCLTMLLGESLPGLPSDMPVIDGDVSSPAKQVATLHSDFSSGKNLTDSATRPRGDLKDVSGNVGEPKDTDDPAYWPQTNYGDLGENIGDPKDPDDPAYWPQTNYDDLGENIGEPKDPDDPADWP